MSRAHPDNVAYLYAVAESHADAATVLTRQGEGVEALAELRKAKAIVEALLANAPDDAKFRTGLKILNDEISKLDKAETAGP